MSGPFRAWVALIGITAVVGVLGLEHRTGRIAGITLLALAFLKVHLVAQEFMEARHAATWLRLALTLYAVGVFVVLTILYLAGAA